MRRKSLWMFTLFMLIFSSGLTAQSDSDAKRRRGEELASRARRIEAGLERLSYLEGNWSAEVLGVAPDGELKPIDKNVPFGFRWIQSHKALASSVSLAGYKYLIYVTYDVNQDRYRISSLDDVSGVLDVYEGGFDEAGTLDVSNVSTGTYFESLGQEWYTRMRLVPKEGGFDWLIDASDDKGASWQPNTVGHVRFCR